MKKALVVFLMIIILFGTSSCQNNSQKPIDVIYVYHSAFGQRYPEYKIDLKNKQYWKFTSDGYENYVNRDSLAENEGFTFICSLDNDNIEAFIDDCLRYGFTEWKNSYNNDEVLDGHQWGITIIFSDLTRKEIKGSNKYPKTWDEMYDAFKNLTGDSIL